MVHTKRQSEKNNKETTKIIKKHPKIIINKYKLKINPVVPSKASRVAEKVDKSHANNAVHVKN